MEIFIFGKYKLFLLRIEIYRGSVFALEGKFRNCGKPESREESREIPHKVANS